jgi:hypothetical protein
MAEEPPAPPPIAAPAAVDPPAAPETTPTPSGADGDDPPLKPPPRRKPKPKITLVQFRQIEAVLIDNGYRDIIEWSEAIPPCPDAKAFALEAIYVICNSGMRFLTANMIYWKCVDALRARQSATTVFGHPGKGPAIDTIWRDRRKLFRGYQLADNKLAYCAKLPWIGPITKYHLAKNLGVDVAKPDVHLLRLAKVEGNTVVDMCERLAKQTGYKVSTVDSVLWRACADGYIESRSLRVMGWERSTEKLREALKLIPPHRLKPPQLGEPHGPPPPPTPPPEAPPSPEEVVE